MEGRYGRQTDMMNTVVRDNYLGRHEVVVPDVEINRPEALKKLYAWLIGYTSACTANKLAL